MACSFDFSITWSLVPLRVPCGLRCWFEGPDLPWLSSSGDVFLVGSRELMSSNFCPHLMLKFGDLIEFLCLRIDLIKICDY